MLTLSRRIVFVFSSRSPSANPINNGEFHYYSLRIARFSNSSNSFHSSSSSSSSSFHSKRDEESRNVKVSVWWDFENCSLPAGANVFKVAQSVTAAVRENGIKGPIQITAFGDMLQLSRSNQEALSATGINLTHIPHGGKNSADRSLLVDLMYWVSQNPPPAHLFLISGDRDFAGILHRLRMNNYNILLASSETTPSVLCSAASIMWHWSALIKGENLTGKYFNQPPDGPYGSWYGHYRVALQDPFAFTEQPACPCPEEVPESNSILKLRPVPKPVVKQICNILRSYPNGISLAEFSAELRSNVNVDKDLYGYKKFSRFLLSMPHILKLQPGNDGLYFVTIVGPRTPEPVEPSPGIATVSATSTEEADSAITPKVNAENGSNTKRMDVNPSLPPISELQAKEAPRKSEPSQMKLQDTPHPENVNNADEAEKVNNADDAEKHLHLVEESNSTSEVGVFRRVWRKWFAVKNEEHDTPRNGSSCIPEERPTTDGSIEKPKRKTYSDKPSREASFFKQIISWCMKSTCQSTDPLGPVPSSLSSNEVVDDKVAGNPNSENLSEQSSEKLNEAIADSGKHVDETFWKEMEAFLDTPPNGSVLVLEQMARNLQKQGPLVLSTVLQSNSQSLPEHEKEIGLQHLPHTGVKEHPEGFNMGSFKEGVSWQVWLFSGCTKAWISEVSNSVTDNTRIENIICSHPALKDDDLDSPWEELRPVDNTGPKQSGRDFVPKRAVNEVTAKRINQDYEALSDDYISDSEEDTSSLTGSEGQGKRRTNDEDSSLLRILDSWYSTEEINRK
ncbi:putative endonuclease or glycosyl hydrolase [Actinidia rufa]|uniref:Putative endonuclease or glycosyl hydrolase n=1 Tax=Actinidia rufa TaxID=165716 RepID=A0A7J0G4B1_9ERIC|nr:putative endonuclease or glycosyl hydrolase [Actinidia rufa]